MIFLNFVIDGRLSERVSVMHNSLLSSQDSHFDILKIFSIIFIIFCCFIDLISEKLGKERNAKL